MRTDDINDQLMIQYDINEAVEILRRTPAVLHMLLKILPEPWLINNEGPDTFSPLM